MGMGYASRELRLLTKTGQCPGIGGYLRPDRLEGDSHSQLRIECLVYLPHASFSNLANDLEPAAEDLSGTQEWAAFRRVPGDERSLEIASGYFICSKQRFDFRLQIRIPLARGNYERMAFAWSKHKRATGFNRGWQVGAKQLNQKHLFSLDLYKLPHVL
jgi:hypothetical protein